jgi:ParB family transcriptional regulator, chromosome partitioning protein
MTQTAFKIEHRPLDWFRTDARELARHDDPEKIRLQGEDMLANGQLQPVGATEDGRMIFGHGRYLAAKAAGIKTLEVKLFPATLSDTQFKLIRAAENLQRKELTGHQKWLLCAELMSGNPAWAMKDLAERLHLDPSMVTRLLSPSKCIQAWQEALAAGKVGISDCYAASKLNETEQAELLRLKLSGASRDAIEQAGRKARAAGTPTVRMSKVKIAMPQGASVVVSGPELSMSDLVELLSETLKEARKAAEQFDVKTWVRMMADKAKAAR